MTANLKTAFLLLFIALSFNNIFANSMQLETNQFKKGIYLLKIASGNKLVAQKIAVK